MSDVDLDKLGVPELNALNDELEKQQQAIREKRLQLVAARNRALRSEHLVPLMYSTGRDPLKMSLEEMESVAVAVKEGKEKSKQIRLAMPVIEASVNVVAPNAG